VEEQELRGLVAAMDGMISMFARTTRAEVSRVETFFLWQEAVGFGEKEYCGIDDRRPKDFLFPR